MECIQCERTYSKINETKNKLYMLAVDVCVSSVSLQWQSRHNHLIKQINTPLA